MSLIQITDAMLADKGVLGQNDVPGLSAQDMQYAVEQITREVVIPSLNANAQTQDAINAQILRKDNTEAYVPEEDYAPATKKYVDDSQFSSGSVSSVFGRAGNVGARVGDYSGAQVVMTGYARPESSEAIATTDTVNQAVGKLDKALDSKASVTHKSSHATGGADALTPADIGAAVASQVTPLLEQIDTGKTANFTVAAADLGKTFLLQNSGALVVTLPTDAALPLPVGFGFYLRRWGAGTVTVSRGSGTVYINGALTAVLLGDRYVSIAAVVKIAANQWSVIGGIE